LITFQKESWRELAHDAAKEIFPRHWRELALDQDKIKLNPDHELYAACDKKGALHVVVGRDAGKVIGYIYFWTMPHPHYKDSGLQAATDAFYLLPEYRRGSIGVRMLIAAEDSLRARGVVKISISTKVHEDHSAIFEALGWRLTDKMYGKLL
jgi:GNAT superfamily N-acetyltransferase